MKQLGLPLKSWGGKRKGAGRPPVGTRAGVSHLRREKVSSSVPLHVTWKVRRDVPGLRTQAMMGVILRAFRCVKRASNGRAFRLIHYSVQHDHVHMIVEADDRSSLS